MGLCIKQDNKTTEKTLRIITLCNYISHTEPLYKNLCLLKVDDILKLQQWKFYYKYLHHDLPIYLQNGGSWLLKA